ncbi:MAG: porin [Casimicrobiaceae bacterium]|nr:porin [Casimicrobiaceae bacterium]MDW8311880.1 porin [Burkholderiales bacterium]
MSFRKTVIAAGIALASTGAFAQTANVTLYGSIRTAMEVAQYKGPQGSARITSQENISSRWGMRGSEALGGGISAIFQLEAGFASDTGAGGGFTRESWVGLQGGFGTLRLGYGLTPYDDVLAWSHHQGANSWENRNNGLSGGAGFAKRDLFTNYTSQANCNSSAFDARYGNSISYQTPTIGGFTLRTQYAIIGEQAGTRCTGWDTAVRFTQGPVRLGLAFAQHNNFTGLGSVNALHDQQAIRAYASYRFGPVMIDGAVEEARYKPASGTLKYRYWEVGALASMGAWTWGVQYSTRDKGLAAGYNPVTQALTVNAATLAQWNNGGGKHFSVTADYALSPRTTLRGYYTTLENERTIVGSALGGKTKINAFALGLWHNF